MDHAICTHVQTQNRIACTCAQPVPRAKLGTFVSMSTAPVCIIPLNAAALQARRQESCRMIKRLMYRGRGGSVTGVTLMHCKREWAGWRSGSRQATAVRRPDALTLVLGLSLNSPLLTARKLARRARRAAEHASERAKSCFKRSGCAVRVDTTSIPLLAVSVGISARSACRLHVLGAM